MCRVFSWHLRTLSGWCKSTRVWSELHGDTSRIGKWSINLKIEWSELVERQNISSIINQFHAISCSWCVTQIPCWLEKQQKEKYSVDSLEISEINYSIQIDLHLTQIECQWLRGNELERIRSIAWVLNELWKNNQHRHLVRHFRMGGAFLRNPHTIWKFKLKAFPFCQHIYINVFTVNKVVAGAFFSLWQKAYFLTKTNIITQWERDRKMFILYLFVTQSH